LVYFVEEHNLSGIEFKINPGMHNTSSSYSQFKQGDESVRIFPHKGNNSIKPATIIGNAGASILG
jgi:hypothetical protein